MIHIIRKSTPRFTKSPSLILIRLVLTEIQLFQNVEINKEMYGHPDAGRHSVRYVLKLAMSSSPGTFGLNAPYAYIISVAINVTNNKYSGTPL